MPRRLRIAATALGLAAGLLGLPQRLPAGGYVATYRVISADTDVVYGGNFFNIGAPGTGRW